MAFGNGIEVAWLAVLQQQPQRNWVLGRCCVMQTILAVTLRKSIISKRSNIPDGHVNNRKTKHSSASHPTENDPPDHPAAST
jgi:hypothetical protein